MGCDPARPDCSVGCQDLIDSMYVKCDGVCMPDGYYYDPRKFQTWTFSMPHNRCKLSRVVISSCSVDNHGVLGGCEATAEDRCRALRLQFCLHCAPHRCLLCSKHVGSWRMDDTVGLVSN
jgi:hypothetical protein